MKFFLIIVNRFFSHLLTIEPQFIFAAQRTVQSQELVLCTVKKEQKKENGSHEFTGGIVRKLLK